MIFYPSIFIETFVRAVFPLIRAGSVELSDREEKIGKRLHCSQMLSFIIYMPFELTQNSFVPMPYLCNNTIRQKEHSISIFKGEKQAFTCQNSSCRKTFTTPLKTLNLQENTTEPYYACPYCLTKLEMEQPKKEEGKVSFEALSQKKHENKQNEGKEKNKTKEKPSECQLHLGYLSERSSKEQIPDDCLVCKDIVECMLKKMRD